jgi:outer membrane protein assembly factor BamB
MVAFLFAGLAGAGDWPQWLGPTRNGVSPEAVPPWQGDLPVAWRRAVGDGHSSPVVAGGRVYLHAQVKAQDREEVLCLDAASGEPLWRSEYARGPFQNPFGTGPRATPLVAGDRVFTLGVTGILACWDAAKGTEVWRRDLLKDFKAPNLFFGVSASPVLDGDRLIVMVGGPEASVVALDKATGKTLWASGSDKASYAAPVVVGPSDRRMLLVLTAAGLTALNPADGSRYWQFPLVDRLNESSTTPVLVRDVAVASSVTYGSVALRLVVKDGQPAYEQLWKNEALTCYFGTPVALGDSLYVVTGRLFPQTAQLHCVELKTGKIRWTRKQPVGKVHATLLLVKDRLLMLEEEGHLVLVQPDDKEYRELARAKVCGKTWAHPAVSDGRLYVRDEKELVCVRLPSP